MSSATLTIPTQTVRPAAPTDRPRITAWDRRIAAHRRRQAVRTHLAHGRYDAALDEATR
jgi:hypothetical protein